MPHISASCSRQDLFHHHTRHPQKEVISTCNCCCCCVPYVYRIYICCEQILICFFFKVDLYGFLVKNFMGCKTHQRSIMMALNIKYICYFGVLYATGEENEWDPAKYWKLAPTQDGWSALINVSLLCIAFSSPPDQQIYELYILLPFFVGSA